MPSSPAKEGLSKAELIEISFRRLEERFEEYSSLPSADAIVGDAGAAAGKARPATAGASPSAGSGAAAAVALSRGTSEFKVSKRIMCLTNKVKQFGQDKGVTATLQWQAATPSGAMMGQFATPSPRVDMTLTRLGWGDHARLVLFGGFEDTGFSSTEIQLFDPLSMRWCGQDEFGTIGTPPTPRAGHTASAFGRHLMLVFGGRGETGTLDELWALQMHRSKSSAGEPARCWLAWSKQQPLGGGGGSGGGAGGFAGPTPRAHHAVAELEETLMLFGGEVILRVAERDMLVKMLEEKQGLSHAKAAELIAQGATAASLQSATLPVLGARDRTDMIGAARFDEMPSAANPPSPRRRPQSASVSLTSSSKFATGSVDPNRPTTPGTPASGRPFTPGTTGGSGGEAATVPGTPLSRSRPSTSGGRRSTNKSPGGGDTSARRSASPPDRRLLAELRTHASRPESASGYRPPPAGLKQRPVRGGGGGVLGDMLGASPGSTLAPQPPASAAAAAAARRAARWVHYPLSDLWKLVARPGGRLQWMAVTPSGPEPFPRSRHVFVGVPSRRLCLLTGGRSVKSNTVLNDLWALDVDLAVWARLEMVGVPAAPRECLAALTLGTSMMLFGGRGRTCRADGALFHLMRDARTGELFNGFEGAVTEQLGEWEHPVPTGLPPQHRQGHKLARLGSDRVLLFGGHDTDGDVWPSATPLLGTISSQGHGMPVAVVGVKPEQLDVKGGRAVTITGRGFRDGATVLARFVVAHRAPLPPRSAAAAKRAPLLLRPLREERSVTVACEYVDADSVRCVLPDMSSMLCDGLVLVEACCKHSGTDEIWSADEAQVELTSKVDVSRLKLTGPGIGGGVAGESNVLLLTTFDEQGRRRATRGDPFGCALRMPGAIEEGDVERLLAPERLAKDNEDGTHELLYVCERAGSFVLTVKLDGETVRELPVTIVAAPTDPKVSELAVKSPLRHGAANVKAGDAVTFTMAPRDRFGNDSAAAADGAPSTFRWELMLMKRTPRSVAEAEAQAEAAKEESVKKKDKDDGAPGGGDDEAAAAAAAAAQATCVAAQPFDDLTQSTPPLEEAGEYELRVFHGDALVRATPVLVAASEMSAAHSTLSGSALWPCKGDGFSAAERAALLVCRDQFGNRVAKTGITSEMSVKLKNASPDGGPEPRVGFSEQGAGVYKLAYGVRVFGEFILTVMLQGQKILEREVSIGGEVVEGDDEERWAEEFSLAQAQAAQAAREAEAARIAAEKCAKREAAEAAALGAEWTRVAAELRAKAKAPNQRAMPAACEALLHQHHRSLKMLLVDLSTPPPDSTPPPPHPHPAPSTGSPPPAPAPAAAAAAAEGGEGAEAEAEAEKPLLGDIAATLSLRGWSVLTKRMAGFVDPKRGRSRAQLAQLFCDMSTAPPAAEGAPAAAAAAAAAAADGGAQADGAGAAATLDERIAPPSFYPPELPLPSMLWLLVGAAAMMARDKAAAKSARAKQTEDAGLSRRLHGLSMEGLGDDELTEALNELLTTHVLPVVPEPDAEARASSGRRSSLVARSLDALSRADMDNPDALPPWGGVDGAWRSLDVRRSQLQRQWVGHLDAAAAAQAAVAESQEAAAAAAAAAAPAPPVKHAAAAQAAVLAYAAGQEKLGAADGTRGFSAASTMTSTQAVALVQAMPELLGPNLSAARVLEVFKESQGEEVLDEHAVDYEYTADFDEWLTCLWRCAQLRFRADADGGKAVEEWLHMKVFPPPHIQSMLSQEVAKAEAAAAKKAKKK